MILTHLDLSIASLHRTLPPQCPRSNQFNLTLIVDVDTVEPSPFNQCCNRFEMRNYVTVAGHYRERLGHEKRRIKGFFGKLKLFDPPSIKLQAFQSGCFSAPGGDHRRRPIDAGNFDSCAREDLTMRRIAAGYIEHPPDRPLQMAPPDLFKKADLPLDITRRLHMDAPEDVRKLIDARLHSQ